MYTSYIGKKFLALYIQKTGKKLTAAQFFEQEFFPLFFDHDKHLMHVSNSPFFQNPAEQRLKESGLTKSRLQFEDLKSKIKEVGSKEKPLPDASMYVGFAADGPLQTTAGQVTTMSIRADSEEIYASWIGNALAARVEGGQCLLADSEEIMWYLYEGWQRYRTYLSQTPHLEGRQIETWNGQWLAGRKSPDDYNVKSKDKKLETHRWIEVLYALSIFHPNQVLPVYVFSLGQTNTTVGFINFHLPQVQRMGQLAQLLVEFNDKTIVQLWQAYEEEYSLLEAIKLNGEIGLKALKPKDFAKLLEGKMTGTKITDKNQNQFAYFKLWIIAMLNNKIELQALAAELAKALYESEKNKSADSGKDEKKDRGTKTEEALSGNVLEAKGLSGFLEALTDLITKNASIAGGAARKTVDEALKMPRDQFPLFKALLRFEYIYLKKVVSKK
jgi:hypothetical protein